MATISGGDRAAKYLANLGRKLGSTARVNVGFMAGATYPDGTSVPLVAALNEFGTEKAPPRPFMRETVSKHSDEWGPQLAAQLEATNNDVEVSLGRMGELIRGQIQQEISTLTEPALAASTIKRKGFEKPLVDTGHMLRSVDYVVKK